MASQKAACKSHRAAPPAVDVQRDIQGVADLNPRTQGRVSDAISRPHFIRPMDVPRALLCCVRICSSIWRTLRKSHSSSVSSDMSVNFHEVYLQSKLPQCVRHRVGRSSAPRDKKT